MSARTVALTAVAPIAWGTTYLTTEALLPPDRPLFSAVVRALPAGLLLLAFARRLPRGAWWWKAGALGLCNIGLFFPLLFLAAYRLPGGLAATLQATLPLAVMALAYVALGERAPGRAVVAALVGLGGVGLLVLGSPGGLDALGLAAGVASVAVAATGLVLTKRWRAPVDMLTLVSWQLVAGGLLLVPVALLVEGAPPAIDAPAALGYLWLGGVGTAVAYVCWFRGLTRMSAGATALVGLLNPVVGTALGALVAGEAFGPLQGLAVALVLGGVLGGVTASQQRSTRRARPVPVAGRPAHHAQPDRTAQPERLREPALSRS
ncbi:EamA family transporter [Nocardioides sp. zg-578]|nr:EamA family transporter [Nocardioides marmotae]MTB83810.1 EamA family transporter [Nocardioides marmotae]